MARARRGRAAGAPNVVIFVLDDVGYGQLSAFGGLCETPKLDRLADQGLRYANFHTTALCSPTRGCVLTGRNHHTLGLSAITELSMGYPAHNGIMGFEHGFLSEMLVERGYNTFAVGKWHLTPPEETTTAGPFNRWPLGRGFERYYGFLGGDTDQWFPDLVHDNHPVPAPATPEEGYHLNADLADHAIGFIQDAHVDAPDKPFFLYYAPGAGHAPHHVEPEWIERYRGGFDGGLGRLPPRGVRAPEGPRACCRPAPSCRSVTPTSRPGSRSRPTSAGCTRARWRPTPGSSSRPTTTSAGSSTSSTASASSTTPW